MPLSTVSEVSNVNSHVIALKQRHKALSDELSEARKRPSVDDQYLSSLKKQKLLIKERLMQEEEQARKQA